MLQSASPLGSSSKTDSRSRTNTRTSSQLFTAVEDDLRDARRVYSDGQEEDLRLALSRIMDRVSELSSLLKDAYSTQTELEDSLNLCKSNLQLVSANNEMLEDALKRDHRVPPNEIGWRRPSARERNSEEQSRRSDEYGSPALPSHTSPKLGTDSANSSPAIPSVVAPIPITNESRFWSRFANGSSTGRSISMVSKRSKTPSHITPNGSAPSTPHLTSASLPSLAPAHNKELEELQAQLEQERFTSKKAVEEKAAIEAELESLSQALFEEANKMVRSERKRRAETEEELREAHLEKEALRSALQIVEHENGRLRSSTSFEPSRSRSSSSVRALKSPPPRTPSPNLDVSEEQTESSEPDSKPLTPSPLLDCDPTLTLPSSISTGEIPAESAETYTTPPEISVPPLSLPMEESPWADAKPSLSMVHPTPRSSSLAAAYSYR